MNIKDDNAISSLIVSRGSSKNDVLLRSIRVWVCVCVCVYRDWYDDLMCGVGFTCHTDIGGINGGEDGAV